jgi:hypothetical protein
VSGYPEVAQDGQLGANEVDPALSGDLMAFLKIKI